MKITLMLFNALLTFSYLSACSLSSADSSLNSNSVAVNLSNANSFQKDLEEGQNRWISLKPTEFDNLPKAVIEHLQSLDCVIPQSFNPKEPNNVIKGEFFKKGQKDWAVLCFRNDNPDDSILFAYPNGSARNVVKVREESSKGYFQGIDGSGTMGFSRGIDTVNEKYILDHYKSYGGAELPTIDHDGINDAFVEKASRVLYFHRGKWLELQGAD